MKRLYLLRHAKSSWGDTALGDVERPLNKRGKRDAPTMGKRLKKRKAEPDLILSSPAKRAVKTASIVAKEIGFPKKKIATDGSIYAASVSELLDVVRNIDDAYGRVMLVGHNPGFTDLADILADGSVGDMPTCAVCCLDFDCDSWKAVSEGGGKIVFYDYPKKAQD